ncbi:MAG: arginine--tRNA ligase [Acidobacteriia bacterium]|nr:arginine--tRNA ligase [Terriglobia bacterium]
MILSVQRLVHRALADAIRRQYGLADVPHFSIEVPPTRALGDLAVPVAFQLARTLRKAPRAIAQELAQALGPIPGVTRVEPAPNGYLNLYLDRRAYLLPRVRQQVAAEAAATEKTIVEHTAINPNKAAHIGHLRNAALGDTLGRVLRFRGTPVEIQNYIDDLGVQVADIIVGFHDIEHRSLDEVRHIAGTTRFDYYCWDLYSRVTGWYDESPNHQAARARVLHELEHAGAGNSDTVALGNVIVDRIVRAHLATMARLNIAYDLLTYEGDIVRLKFWAHAFETLKAQGAIYLQTEGKLAGCWVMKIEEAAADAIGADGAEPARPGEDEAREKVIVRSNGVVTYIGKDLANQFWKLGLLGHDFHYKRFGTQAGGRALWSTTSGTTDPNAPAFGRAAWIYNVIDSRQMYLQALLSQALRALGHAQEAERSIHFSYEMVALSHATARELGYEPHEGPAGPGDVDAKKPFVEVSGRKGLGVKIDDLLDLLTNKAAAEVAKRNPEFSQDECRRVGSQIAVAAIRYFMLKYSRGKLIVFDIEEALSFEGETGPYLQYAAVRANNIFHKLQEREHLSEADVLGGLEALSTEELDDDGEAHTLWAVAFEASRLDEVVEQVVRSLEFSGLAKYAFGLAQLFSAFYHRYPILNEEQADRKRWRAAGVAYFRMQLTRALDLMGIEVPSRM